MTFNSSAIDSAILKALTEEVANVAEKARSNASWSNRIPKAISLGKAEKTGEMRYQMDLIVDSRRKGPAPHAAAFEYGSGLHDPDAPGLYPIKAKDPSTQPLHFWWGNKGKWFIGAELPFGHPGVEAKPYLAPAIKSEKARYVKKLKDAFKQGYRNSVPRVTVIRA